LTVLDALHDEEIIKLLFGLGIKMKFSLRLLVMSSYIEVKRSCE